MEEGSKNGRVIKYFLIEFFIVALVILGIFFYLKQTSLRGLLPSTSKSELPIKTKSSGVKLAFVSYFLSGTVKSITLDRGDIYTLVLSEYPDIKLPIHENSEVSADGGIGKKKIKAMDLKMGDKIIVSINYDLQGEKWIPLIPIPSNLKTYTNPANIPSK